jgi:pimeloyl-ACP methyl ester carboxylesterase
MSDHCLRTRHAPKARKGEQGRIRPAPRFGGVERPVESSARAAVAALRYLRAGPHRYGAAQPWAQDRRLTILDEVLRVEGLIPCCDGDFHLVGYSYGGAVALALAVAQPLRIKSLTLIDPVFFAALERGGEQASLDVLRGVQGRFAAGLMKGDRANAMRDFTTSGPVKAPGSGCRKDIGKRPWAWLTR